MIHRSSTSNQEPPVLWYGDSWLTSLLLAYCRLIPFFRGRGRSFQWAAKYLFGGSLAVHNYLGARLKIDPGDYIGRTIAFEASFEPRSLALAVAIMREGGTFLDVGCNIGLYTLSVGVLPGVRCIAIDASFVALAKLRDNLARNAALNATLVSCALGFEHTLRRFHVGVDQNLGSTRVAEESACEDSSLFWVASVSLQDVLERLSPGRIRLLKVDVEGSEMSVFRGLDFDGPYRPENLIVECYTDEFPQAQECFEFLLCKGYEAMNVDGEPVIACRNLPEHNVWFRYPN